MRTIGFESRLPTRAVSQRYGISTRTVTRWQCNRDLAFPQPLRVNGRRYWSLNELETWERRRVAGIHRPLVDSKTLPLTAQSEVTPGHDKVGDGGVDAPT